MARSSSTRTTALVACLALATGCFGYNASAKRWAYVGDTVLVLGGGGLIAADLTGSDPAPCMPGVGVACPYEAPVSGVLVTGAVLAAAGLVGYLLNATRPNVKSSR